MILSSNGLSAFAPGSHRPGAIPADVQRNVHGQSAEWSHEQALHHESTPGASGPIMLDLNLIRVLAAVIEEGTLTAAADRLNLTQPSITHAVNRLRRLTGDDLFRRSGRGVRPTRVALQLYAELGHLPRDADAALARLTVFDPSTAATTFRAAMTDLGQAAFLPALSSMLERAAPRARLDVLPLDTDTAARDLEAGDIDLAIASIPLEGRIRSMPITRDRYVGVSRAGRFGTAPTLDALARLPRVVVRGTTGHTIVESRLPPPPPGSVTVDGFSGIPAVVSGTGLLAVVPGIVVPGWTARWPLHAWELPLPDVETTVFIHAAQGGATAAVDWFVERAAAALQDSRPGTLEERGPLP
ncbi:MAG: LysR family transcriptional regulator [Citricoccus sp.]|nr:LysR family transcriptional regulator [Citricoccus sp. WCRC_4]